MKTKSEPTSTELAESYQRTYDYPLGAALKDFTSGKLKDRKVLHILTMVDAKKAESASFNPLTDWQGWDI